ncbi:hypothetical protein T484DRAFT_2971588 [Baffinella frigidus]|nr:hypothetical protein T484DRAFT_2971588 [Cryptophyta sp. CCMP2293]
MTHHLDRAHTTTRKASASQPASGPDVSGGGARLVIKTASRPLSRHRAAPRPDATLQGYLAHKKPTPPLGPP